MCLIEHVYVLQSVCICTKHSRAFHRIPRDVVSDPKSTEVINNPNTIRINNTSDANH